MSRLRKRINWRRQRTMNNRRNLKEGRQTKRMTEVEEEE
jgi:hypothetical protein